MTATEQRHLAAILVLDVFGFSRMMAADESGTLARVLAQRRAVIEPRIAEHGGRVVKRMGDGVLAEFPSVTAAVQCAVAIQGAVAGAAGPDSGEEPLLLRIGINLGEVVVEDDDIYGDGVNVAARLEALACPGGIAISGAAHDQLKSRLPVVFEDIGRHTVKNIPAPVQVYHLAPDAGPAVAGHARPRRRRRLRGALAALVVMAGLGAGAWAVLDPQIWPAQAVADPLASFDPGRPSVVVLPFDDLSGQPGQGYFSDGITDNLITDLSRVGGLLVIARNTSFAFRGRAVEMTRISRDLGVTYVVTGSVQRADDRVRINAALTDAVNGYQLWADRFDRDNSDLFALQDEVTERIVAALQVEMTQQEERLLAMQDTDDVEAYDQFLKARSITRETLMARREIRTRAIGAADRAEASAAGQALQQALQKVRNLEMHGAAPEDIAAARLAADVALQQWLGTIGDRGLRIVPPDPAMADLALQAALRIDPDFAAAQVLMSARQFDLTGAPLLELPAMIARADVLARQAPGDQDTLPLPHSIHALNLLFEGQHRQAVQSARRALALDPNDADGFALLGWVLHFVGQPEEALQALKIARRLNPLAPPLYPAIEAEIRFSLGEDAATLEAADAAISEDPRAQRARLYRAAALANLGRFDAARAQIAELSDLTPGLTLSAIVAIAPYRDAAGRDRLIAGLRIAGLPE